MRYYLPMRNSILRPVLVAGAAVLLCLPLLARQQPSASPQSSASPLPQEKHLKNLRKLTNGIENAEAYFSFDGKRLIFQSTTTESGCDQIYTMNLDGSDRKLVSTGKGRTTCGYFYPDGKSILYASTHGAGAECPPKPGYERGYVWPVYDSYEIYRANADGSGLTNITNSPGYDAEATIAPDGRITFTSTRDGDMEIYSMAHDGSDVRRLTNRPGPDGGPFFSFDGQWIAFRGRELPPGKELDDFRLLLKQGLWRPTALEIFIMDRNGGNVRQITHLGQANFAPSWTPDGKKLIFASNRLDPSMRNFDLYTINIDGTGLEQITFNPTFDGFPMFSPDGKKLVFASNRQDDHPGETNIFIADWIP